ncbi:MAG TPA: hypothetical protein VFR63_11445 [Gaiellaceae bacterium]|nr:hypothetical protein [Gaiellaceae bacterium]
MSTPLRERPDAPLGTLIFRAGLLPAETIESALEEGVKTGKRLGEILTERGLLKEVDLARLLAGQKGLDFVTVREHIVDPAAAGLFTPEQARLFRALPYAFEDGLPVVAIPDPTDEVLTRNIREALGRDEIRFVVSTRGEIAELVEDVYSRPLATPAEAEPAPAAFAAPAPPESPEPGLRAEPPSAPDELAGGNGDGPALNGAAGLELAPLEPEAPAAPAPEIRPATPPTDAADDPAPEPAFLTYSPADPQPHPELTPEPEVTPEPSPPPVTESERPPAPEPAPPAAESPLVADPVGEHPPFSESPPDLEAPADAAVAPEPALEPEATAETPPEPALTPESEPEPALTPESEPEAALTPESEPDAAAAPVLPPEPALPPEPEAAAEPSVAAEPAPAPAGFAAPEPPAEPSLAPEPARPAPLPAEPTPTPLPEPGTAPPAPVAHPPAASRPDADTRARANAGALFRVSVRLTNGERVDAGAFAEPAAAQECARAVMAQVAGSGQGEWPFVSGRFLKPDTIVSVDIDEHAGGVPDQS